MSTDNKEFYDLLDQIVNEQTFDLELTNGQIVKCKQLSTAQLKELIKTMDDSPVTQTLFNSTASKIFKDSVVNLPADCELNVIDRMLFLLETRIQNISSTITLLTEDKEAVTVNLAEVKTKILHQIKSNKEVFDNTVLTLNNMSLLVGLASLNTEEKLNSEILSEIDIERAIKEQMAELLSELFVYEIAKSIQIITLFSGQTLNLINEPFKVRVETLQKLPAHVTQQVISYVEKQKKLIEECLFAEGVYITIDSSLFTVY